jgi:hypothetical protein
MHCKALTEASRDSRHMAFWDTYESLRIHILLNCSFLFRAILWANSRCCGSNALHLRDVAQQWRRQMPQAKGQAWRYSDHQKLSPDFIQLFLLLDTIAHLLVTLGICRLGFLLLARTARPLGRSLGLATVLGTSCTLGRRSLWLLGGVTGTALKKLPAALFVHVPLFNAECGDAVADTADSSAWR